MSELDIEGDERTGADAVDNHQKPPLIERIPDSGEGEIAAAPVTTVKAG